MKCYVTMTLLFKMLALLCDDCLSPACNSCYGMALLGNPTNPLITNTVRVYTVRGGQKQEFRPGILLYPRSTYSYKPLDHVFCRLILFTDVTDTRLG